MGREKISRLNATVFWLIVALAALVIGFAVGANMSQPVLLAQPTHEVLAQTEQLDQVLLGELRDPRDVTDELRKLRAKVAKLPNGQGADIATDIDIVSAKLAEQNDSLQQSVWKAHEAVSGVRSRLKGQAEASNDPASVFYDQLRRFLKWTGPIVALGFLLLALAVAHPRIRAWLARAKTVGVGPLSVAVGDVSALKRSIRETFNEVDAAIVATYKEKIEKFDLEELFLVVKKEIDKQLMKTCGVDMNKVSHRATMFVPGFTDEQLVQVTKYAPPEDRDRPVVGRRFSVRYGMIGRAFRLRKPLYNWDVDNWQNRLVRYWGLTRVEAFKQGSHPASLMAFPIPIDSNSDPLAIVYIQAEGKNQLMPKLDSSVLGAPVPDDPDDRVAADVLANDGIWKPIWDANRVQPLYEALQAMKAEFTWDTPLQGRDGQ